MDGFYVAKFKIGKKTSSQRNTSPSANENEIERTNGVENDGEIGFDSDEDKTYIEGLVQLFISDNQSLTLLTENKRRRLKAKGIRVTKSKPAAS